MGQNWLLPTIFKYFFSRLVRLSSEIPLASIQMEIPVRINKTMLKNRYGIPNISVNSVSPVVINRKIKKTPSPIPPKTVKRMPAVLTVLYLFLGATETCEFPCRFVPY